MHRPEQPFAQRRGLQEHEEREKGDGGQRDDRRDDRPAQVGTQGQRRFAEIVGVLLEFGGVLLHPGEETEPLEGMGQPPVAPLHLVHHGRESFGHAGERVDQGIAEQGEQSTEDQDRSDEHHADRCPSSEPTPLQGRDCRIQDECDEAGDQDPEDHLAQPPEQAVEDPGGDHHRIDGQDRAERHTFGRCCSEESISARGVWSHAAVEALDLGHAHDCRRVAATALVLLLGV